MKDILFAMAIFSVMMAMSCGDGNVVIQTDPAIQAAEDSATIVNYLADLGYTGESVEATNSGVRYVILDEGTGEAIDESDIVSFDYTGKLLNDTIFDTSIQEVADSIRAVVEADTVGKDPDTVTEQINILNSFPDSKEYEPFIITYSASGWTTNGQFIPGFSDGVSATFNKMRTGGSALIVLPSAEAYGTRGSGFLIEPNSVIAFELYPRSVKKQ